MTASHAADRGSGLSRIRRAAPAIAAILAWPCLAARSLRASWATRRVVAQAVRIETVKNTVTRRTSWRTRCAVVSARRRAKAAAVSRTRAPATWRRRSYRAIHTTGITSTLTPPECTPPVPWTKSMSPANVATRTPHSIHAGARRTVRTTTTGSIAVSTPMPAANARASEMSPLANAVNGTADVASANGRTCLMAPMTGRPHRVLPSQTLPSATSGAIMAPRRAANPGESAPASTAPRPPRTSRSTLCGVVSSRQALARVSAQFVTNLSPHRSITRHGLGGPSPNAVHKDRL
ncbi:hypothetical protein GALL_360400 [mine drainage metagenome]|uniref:Uncharacterized protein n=1 Tax=mine drainage metagenome TaxID=410659 RepID=A0A1J5QQG4_9ZZZZ